MDSRSIFKARKRGNTFGRWVNETLRDEVNNMSELDNEAPMMGQIVRLLCSAELERHLTRTDSAQEIALALLDKFDIRPKSLPQG